MCSETLWSFHIHCRICVRTCTLTQTRSFQTCVCNIRIRVCVCVFRKSCYKNSIGDTRNKEHSMKFSFAAFIMDSLSYYTHPKCPDVVFQIFRISILKIFSFDHSTMWFCDSLILRMYISLKIIFFNLHSSQFSFSSYMFHKFSLAIQIMKTYTYMYLAIIIVLW